MLMDLAQAIEFAENQKAKWEKFRGSEINDFIWYVSPFNKGYIVIDTTTIKRHPDSLKKVVYDTKIGIYR